MFNSASNTEFGQLMRQFDLKAADPNELMTLLKEHIFNLVGPNRRDDAQKEATHSYQVFFADIVCLWRIFEFSHSELIDLEGRTPLHHAAQSGAWDTIYWLKRLDIDFFQKDKNDKTAEQVALDHNNFYTVTMINNISRYIAHYSPEAVRQRASKDFVIARFAARRAQPSSQLG